MIDKVCYMEKNPSGWCWCVWTILYKLINTIDFTQYRYNSNIEAFILSVCQPVSAAAQRYKISNIPARVKMALNNVFNIAEHLEKKSGYDLQYYYAKLHG